MAEVKLESRLTKFIQSISASEEDKTNIVNVFAKHRLTSPEMVFSFDVQGLYQLGVEYGYGLQLLKAMREDGVKQFDEAPKTSKIFTHGLPPLAVNPSGGSSSNSSFVLVDSIPKPNITSRLWSLFDIDSRSAFRWNSEEDIRIRVVHAIEDIIDAAGLRDIIEIKIELGIFRERPDLWVVMVAGFPIGVVEVKKPGENAMSNPKVFGQLYDYLLRLSSFYGIQHVFGILTTYSEWRICWLRNSDDAAKSKDLPDPSSANIKSLQNGVPEWEDDYIDNSPEEDSEDAALDRTFYGTKIYQGTNNELPKYLVSVLLKMYHSPHSHVQLVDPNRPYIQLKKTMWVWTKFAKDLVFKKIPNNKTTNFVLLRDFRGGAHGRVWLAASLSGCVCVLKFAKSLHPTSLKEECDIWTNVWEIPAFLTELSGHQVLVMPYVSGCTYEQAQRDEEIKAAVILAIKKLAAKKKLHNDLGWRHVGLFKFKGTLRAILFDLADMKKNVPEKTSILTMLNALKITDN